MLVKGEVERHGMHASCVKNDLKRLNFDPSMATDRGAGACERLTRASMEIDVND